MNLFSVFDITSAGLSVEQTKLAVAASNIANARTTKMADGTVYKPLSVLVRATPANYQDAAAALTQSMSPEGDATVDSLPRPAVAGVVASDAAPRMVYDPGNPDANAKGFVAMPASDPVSSMLELMTISRSYEANLRAFDITRSLIQHTLDIGRMR